jgi:putative ABC transport system permease protein
MRAADLWRMSLAALRAHRLRSLLTGLGIAVGVAAVVLLTAIGEGIHRFVMSEFTQFGTNLIAVVPGRSTTLGLPGAVIGTTRPLDLDDAEALRRVVHVEGIAPVVQGNAEIESAGRRRRTTVLGTGPEMPTVYRFRVALGAFLPEDDPRAPRAFAVVGARVRRELFGEASPLGQRLRVGGERYRITGVMEPKGQVLGFDLDDTVYIPVTRALQLFDREELMEIDVLYRAGAPADEVVGGIRRVLLARHGQEDFTVVTQQQMLEVLGSILGVLTFAIGALGGISLAVGGVGILTIATIAVSERTSEIGLLRALGAERRLILTLFLAEAVALAALGGAGGLVWGAGGAWLLGQLLPQLPVHISWPFVLLAEGIAVAVGLGAGILPARRAARLDPLEALRSE